MIQYSVFPDIWNAQKFIKCGGYNISEMYLCSDEVATLTPEEFLALSPERKAEISLLRVDDNNQLQVFDLTGFTALNVLDIYRANIREILGVSSLYKLNTILAEDNRLTTIDEFVDLPNLLWLDCPSNKLRSIKSFPATTLICQVDFRDNPFEEIVGLPPEDQILECGMSWYREIQVYNEWRQLRKECELYELRDNGELYYLQKTVALLQDAKRLESLDRGSD